MTLTETDDTVSQPKRPLARVMGAFYVGAGVMHFVVPDSHARVVPPQLPRPVALVYLSGIAEIVLGTGVLIRRTRRLSAWGLIALLIAVFPANVHMATSDTVTAVGPDGLPASLGWCCGRASRFKASCYSGRGRTRACHPNVPGETHRCGSWGP